MNIRPARRQPRPSRRFLAAGLTGAALLAAAATAAALGAPSAAALTAASSPSLATPGSWRWSPVGGPSTWRPGPPWSSRTGAGWWPGSHGWPWAPGKSTHIEHFDVVSTNPAGPGTIIVTGPVNAGGTEKPGRAVDTATFAGGSFRIDHSTGQPTVHFDPTTCVGTITQVGPFSVIDATGDMSGLAGSGRYLFRALYITARAGGHCSSTMTAYTETIQGAARVKA